MLFANENTAVTSFFSHSSARQHDVGGSGNRFNGEMGAVGKMGVIRRCEREDALLMHLSASTAIAGELTSGRSEKGFPSQHRGPEKYTVVGQTVISTHTDAAQLEAPCPSESKIRKGRAGS